MSGIGLGLSGLNIAARLTGAKAMLAKIPPKVWYALAAVALLVSGVIYHQHRVRKHDAALVKATIAAEDARWTKALDKAHADALAWKAKTDQQAATIAQDERKKHDEDLRLNAAVADALRLRGPGAASAGHCGQGYHPGPAAAPDRHDQAASAAGAPTGQVPSGDWAVVPWNWLVSVLQEHDDLLADVKRVIENDRKQRANWPKEAPQPH